MFGGLLATLAMLWTAVSLFGGGLFRAAAGRAASEAGLLLALDGEPELSLSGFRVAGLHLRRPGDDGELLSVERISGQAVPVPGPPWLRWSLRLRGVEARWPSASAPVAEDGASGSFPNWPSALAGLTVDGATFRIGAAKLTNLATELRRGSDGSLVLNVARADYDEDSGERAAEKLSGTLQLNSAAPGSWRLQAGIDGGSALFGSTLLDFGAVPLSVSALVSAEPAGGWRASALTVGAGTLLRGEGSVVLGDDASLRSADGELESDDLEPLFRTLVLEPYGAVVPALAEGTLQGRGKLKLRFDSWSRHALDATLTLQLARLKTRSADAEAVEVDLPWIGAQRVSDPSRSGHLRARRVTLLAMPGFALDTVLLASAGRLRSRGQQHGEMFGGTVHLSDLEFEDDPGGGPRLSGNLRLDGVDLAALGEAVGWTGLSGRAGGALGRVTMDAKALTADGHLDVAVFGGTIALSRLTVTEPFGRVPVLVLDAAVSGVDLGALTQALGVGRVNGVLEGRVSGLAIAAGQPQAFDADLHTVARKGVPQNVDVRAIVQLGVLGGADSGSITGTLLRMVDRYRYSALGIKARLRNDVFEIHGVRSRQGRDYLVEGSLLPPSVSVVSHSQVVSFSEMLRRVQRIAAIGEGGTPNAASP